MQASNFGGTFDQLFLWVFYEMFSEDASLRLLYHGAKSQKWPKTHIKGGGGPEKSFTSATSKKYDFWEVGLKALVAFEAKMSLRGIGLIPKNSGKKKGMSCVRML